MMLRYSFKLPAEAVAVENAVDKVLMEGYTTADMADRGKCLGTVQMGAIICKNI